MTGTPRQISEFKKGKRFCSLCEAETELWKLAHGVEGEADKVAYEVASDDAGESHLYGTILLTRLSVGSDVLVKQVVADYGVHLAEETTRIL